MLNKSSDKGHSGLVPVFQGTLLVFLHLVSAILEGLVRDYIQAGFLSYFGVNPPTILFLVLGCFVTHL